MGSELQVREQRLSERQQQLAAQVHFSEFCLSLRSCNFFFIISKSSYFSGWEGLAPCNAT